LGRQGKIGPQGMHHGVVPLMANDPCGRLSVPGRVAPDSPGPCG